MFSRTDKAERTASQAWDYLSSAMATATDSARGAGAHAVDVTSAQASRLKGKAGRKSTKFSAKAKKNALLAGAAGGLAGAAGAAEKVNAVADEALARATAAANALAGRKPGLPWGLIAGVGLLGAALGWAAATTARAALERQAEQEELELAETAVVVTPTYDR
jgi:hypothetical protein